MRKIAEKRPMVRLEEGTSSNDSPSFTGNRRMSRTILAKERGGLTVIIMLVQCQSLNRIISQNTGTVELGSVVRFFRIHTFQFVRELVVNDELVQSGWRLIRRDEYFSFLGRLRTRTEAIFADVHKTPVGENSNLDYGRQWARKDDIHDDGFLYVHGIMLRNQSASVGHQTHDNLRESRCT